MSISSNEINLLIQQYLQELGYDHSAFAFGYESQIPQCPLVNRDPPPGSLIFLIQKGLMYAQIESAVDESIASPTNQINGPISNLMNLHKISSDMEQEVLNSTTRLHLLPKPEQLDSITYYLNDQCSLVLDGHNEGVFCAAWSSKSNFLATASIDGIVIVWYFNKGKNGITTVDDHPRILIPQPNEDKPPDVTAICWHPKEDILAVGTYSGDIVIYDKEDEIQRINFHINPIVSLQYNATGELLVSCSSEGDVQITKQGDSLNHWKLEDGNITDCAWIDDSSIIISCGLKILKMGLKSDVKVLYENPEEINQLEIKKDRSMFAIGDSSGSVKVMNKEGKITTQLQLHRSDVCAIAWSHNKSPTLVSGGKDGTLKMLNIDDEQITPFDGHITPVYSVAVDPRNRYLASASSENVVNLWSLRTNHNILTYSTEAEVNAMFWSNDGKFLSICLNNGKVSVVDFDVIC